MNSSRTLKSVIVEAGGRTIEMNLNTETGRYEVRGTSNYYGADQIDRILQNAESKGATITRTYDAPKVTASDQAADYAAFSAAFDKGEVNIFGEANSEAEKIEQLAYIRDFAK